MAIVFDTAVIGGNNSGVGSSITWSHTCTTGTNGLLLVNVTGDTVLDDIFSVTYNGVGLTLIASVNGGDRFNYLYYMLKPPNGAHDIVVTSDSDHLLIGNSASWKGVKRLDASVTNTGTISPNTTSLTTIANNCIVVIGTFAYQNITPGTGSITRVIDTTGYKANAIFEYASDPKTPPGSVSMSFTWAPSSNGSATIMASFAPVIAPTATDSTTVDLGFINPDDGEQIYYVGAYYNDSCYSFYRGSVRWIAITQYPSGSILVPEAGAMFKSIDNGATFNLIGGVSPPVSSGGGYTSPAYDVAFASFDDVGVDPNTATKLTTMGNDPAATSTYLGFFMDFNFTTETWGPIYGNVAYPTLGVSSEPNPSSTPSGGFAHTVIAGSAGTPPFITVGATVVGPSPWMIIDAANNAHIGDGPGGIFLVNRLSRCGNVRIHSGIIIFAQVNDVTGNMEVLSKPVSSGTWTVEIISVIAGLYDANQPPWMCSATNLFFIGANHHSIYLTQKVGGVWGAATQIWSMTTDTNPDFIGARPRQVWQLVASPNPALGGTDITFEYDGLVSRGDAMFTFNLPGVDCEGGITPPPPGGSGWASPGLVIGAGGGQKGVMVI